MAAYANSFAVPFVFDDYTSILQNPVVKNLEKFLSGDGYAYNPRRFVGYLTLALNYHFGGLNVLGYHLVNLIIHIANGFLVYALAALAVKAASLVNGERETVNGKTASTVHSSPLTGYLPLFASLLFVLHPIQTQAVTYIVQRLASLATFWYLAAVVLYLKGRLLKEEGKGSFLVPALMTAAVVTAVLAMRTKEIAFTLPAAVLLLEFSFFRLPTRKRLFFVVPLICAILALAVAVLQVDRPLGELLNDVNEMTRETRDISRSTYLFTQFSVIMTYLRLMVLPVSQNLDYDYPLYDSFLNPHVVASFLGILLLLALGVYFYWTSRRDGFRLLRLAGFGIFWFFLTLSVESSIIPIRDVIFEHRLYLPSAGLFIAVAAVVQVIGRQHFALLVGGAVVACLALGLVTFNRNSVWRDNITLWSDVAAKSPAKYRPLFNLGKSYADAGRTQEAGALFEKALVILPNDPETLYNMAVVTAKGGDEAQAEELFRRVLAIEPRYVNAIHNLAQIEASRGNYPKAEKLFLQVKELDPQSTMARSNLGLLYRLTNRAAQAEAEYRAALELDTRDADVWNRLGVLYVSQGRLDEAAEQFRRAIQYAPDRSEYVENLKRALAVPR
jgi:Flp pilus assembly protein TadD